MRRRTTTLIAFLAIACSDRELLLPDGGTAPVDGSGSEPDGGAPDGGAPDSDAPDVPIMDSGDTDAGSQPCSTLQRDVCLATPGCVLDGSEDRDPGYVCRDAITPCERIKDPDACELDADCVFVPADCYCPEDIACACGGGPAQACRERCGGIAGVECPGTAFFCELPMDEGNPGGPICTGNADQLGTCVPIPPACTGAGGGPVCGCEDDVTPVTYANDCERRRASASFGALGACP